MRKLPHFTQHKQGDAFGNISVAGTINAGDGPVLLFASSFDGRYLAAAIQDKIILYEVTEAEPYLRHMRDFIGHTDTICDLDFTSSGDNLVLSASCDKSVKVWYVEEDKCLATFRHDEVVSSVLLIKTILFLISFVILGGMVFCIDKFVRKIKTTYG